MEGEPRRTGSVESADGEARASPGTGFPSGEPCRPDSGGAFLIGKPESIQGPTMAAWWRIAMAEQ